MANDRPSARFYDRLQAGNELAADLRRFLQGQNPVVLAIPPGGVQVAACVAAELDTPLDVMVSRRIIVPHSGGETLGAITPDRTFVINKALVTRLGIPDEDLEQLSISAWAEAQEALHRYRSGRPYGSLHGRTAVIIDDGVTSGYTIMGAVIAARKLQPDRVVVAVPVATIEAIERLGAYADEVLSLEISTRDPFSVADHYSYYPEVNDEEIRWMLEHFWSERPPHGHGEMF